MVLYSLFFIFDILLCEELVRFKIYGTLMPGLWLIAFTVIAGLLTAWFSSLFKGLLNRVFALFFSAALLLFYAANLVYYHIFRSCLSVAQIGMGTDAVRTFGTETAIGIRECGVYLAIMALPFIIMLYCFFRGRPKYGGLKAKGCFIWLAVIAIGFGGTLAAIYAQPPKTYGIREVYGDDFVLSFANRRFGTLTATRLELQKRVFGAGAAGIKNEDQAGSESYDSLLYNACDIDFAALSRGTQELSYQTLDSYFAGRLPSRKNEFTGKYSDYNVITILCESFSPYLIDEKRTPTLYRLSKESIQFSNYYSCSADNTSNSEYSFLTSLLPDISLFVPDGAGFEHFKIYNSCTASQKNYLPYTLGNQFRAQGVKTAFYHNYLASFYGRELTHGNFGYELCTMNNGLKYSPYWPTSDYDMMKQIMPLMLEKNAEGGIDRFHAYILTFSGHMAYNFESNTIAASNIALVEALTGQKIERLDQKTEASDPEEDPLPGGTDPARDPSPGGADFEQAALPDGNGDAAEDALTREITDALAESASSEESGKKSAGYSREVLAYIAGNMELEKAVKYMLEELEKAGVLDKTLIVMTADHYPYGLGIGRLSELAGSYLAPDRNFMELNKYKGWLVIWTPSIAEEDIPPVDYPVCELDILPTISNMCGLEYDSRLLMGVDIFDRESEHMAIFGDRSFVAPDFFYNAESGDCISFGNEKISEEKLDKYIGAVRNKFALSQNMLYSDYYAHVFNRKSDNER